MASVAPTGFDIDPTTGMPKLARQPKTPAADVFARLPGATDTTTPFPASTPTTTPAPTPSPTTFPSPTYPASPVLDTPTTTASAPLSGWESVKSGNWNKAWVDFVTQSYGQGARGAGFANLPPGGLAQAVKEFNAATGANAKVVGTDSVDFGNGMVIDAVTNSQGQGPQYLWSSVDPGSGGATGGGSAGGAGGSVGSLSGGSLDPDLHKAIMDLLGRGTSPVSADDPTIKANVDAARVTGTRQLADARAAAAERASAEGMPTATFDNAVLGNEEKFGENMSALQSGLMLNELNNRRQDVVNALQFASGEDARALQLQLAQMDDVIKRMQLGQQNQQFYDSLSATLGEDQNAMNTYIASLLTGGS